MPHRLSIYLSAKWESREDARALGERLEQHGYRITHKWWYFHGSDREQAVADLDGVRSAEILVVLLEPNRQYKGVWVELGAALALARPVVVMGDGQYQTPFLLHPRVLRVCDEDQLLDVLEWLEAIRQT